MAMSAMTPFQNVDAIATRGDRGADEVDVARAFLREAGLMRSRSDGG
jgi:hypothetical protein